MNLSPNMSSYQIYPNLPMTILTPGKIQPDIPLNKIKKQIEQKALNNINQILDEFLVCYSCSIYQKVYQRDTEIVRLTHL